MRRTSAEINALELSTEKYNSNHFINHRSRESSIGQKNSSYQQSVNKIIQTSAKKASPAKLAPQNIDSDDFAHKMDLLNSRRDTVISRKTTSSLKVDLGV